MFRYVLMSSTPAVATWLLLASGLSVEVAGALGICAAVALFVVGELLTSARASLSARVVRRDIVHAVLSGATAQICMLVATVLLGYLPHQTLQASWLVQVALLVVGVDLLAYWGHRAQHRISWLWAPHAVHHMPTELYWLNGLRAHPGDTAWAFAISTLWVLVLGFSAEAFVIAGTFTMSHLLMQHTRVRFPAYLEIVFVTPRWHRVHHDRSNRSHSANLSQVFTIWDRIFGTYRPSDPPPARLGIEDPVDDSLIGELLFPLRATASRCSC